MLLEEFENVPAVIEPTDRSLISGGEICDTIILSFNGEILERVKQIDGVYEGGYLTNLNSKYPWYIYEVDGFIFDLGVSSYQLDTPERGFSYMNDGPLDMRMDREQSVTAKDIVNEYSESELFRIIKEYGEERFARNIAKNICRQRKEKPIETTLELVDLIRGSMPAKARNGKSHPAKRTFQAIRIECNRELDVLRQALDDMVDLLCDGGRLSIITFHSLEDRMVKTSFKKQENPCTCPPDFPVCVCGKKPKGKVVTRKPILPSEEELERNTRSKSAKLRVFEKIEC